MADAIDGTKSSPKYTMAGASFLNVSLHMSTGCGCIVILPPSADSAPLDRDSEREVPVSRRYGSTELEGLSRQWIADRTVQRGPVDHFIGRNLSEKLG
jgi:hypothetical protein